MTGIGIGQNTGRGQNAAQRNAQPANTAHTRKPPLIGGAHPKNLEPPRNGEMTRNLTGVVCSAPCEACSFPAPY